MESVSRRSPSERLAVPNASSVRYSSTAFRKKSRTQEKKKP